VAEQRKLAASEAAVAADQAKHNTSISHCKDRSAKALYSTLAKLTSTPEKVAFAASVRAKYFVPGLSIAFSPFVVVEDNGNLHCAWSDCDRADRHYAWDWAEQCGRVSQERLLEHIATAHFNGQKDLVKIGKRAAEPALQPGQRQLQFEKRPRVAPGIAPSASPAPTQSTAIRGAAPQQRL